MRETMTLDPVRDDFYHGMMPWNRKRTPAQIIEGQRIIHDLLSGAVHPEVWLYKLRETQSTSDFPLYMADTLDRLLLGGYAEGPYMWNQIARLRTVRDFRQASSYAIDGAEGQLDEVGELEQYPETSVEETKYTLQAKKYGKRMPFSWELIINDDLGAFTDTPMRFGKAARRTEQKLVTSAYAANATFFSAANKNLALQSVNAALSANNAPFSEAGVQDLFILLGAMLDTDGEPIVVDGVTLVVPPALEIAAEKLINATQFVTLADLTMPASTNVGRIVTANWIRPRVTVAVDHYLPIVDGSTGNTGYYLFANPNSGRPAMNVAKLRGRENPELFMKAPNAIRVGGGAVSPFDGDFDTDAIQYKIRHCFGVAMVDPKMAVRSKGNSASS